MLLGFIQLYVSVCQSVGVFVSVYWQGGGGGGAAG